MSKYQQAQPIRQVADRTELQSVHSLPQISVGLTTLQGFELSQRAAKVLASSSLVPKEYQGNLANCIVALNMASRIGADPLMVCQNLYLVHGRPSWSAQFLIATFNTCGRFSAIRYEFFGEKGKDSYGCRAYATELSTGEKLVGTDVTLAIAKAEGWFSRNGSKWQTMPQQMLQYRAASWFVRTVAPELSMGLHTAEEMHDVYDAEPTPEGAFAVPAAPAQEQVIPETGEIVQTEPQHAPAWTPNDAAAELENAESEDQVNEILDRARSTFKKAHMMALQPFADKRLVELRGAE